MLTSSMLALLGRAIHKPGYTRHGPTIHEWDISGRCQRPVTRELVSRPLTYGRTTYYGRGLTNAYSLILHTRCRMCDYCKQAKAALWTGRAASEFKSSARTWFGTLTLRPSAQHLLVSKARVRLAAGGTDFDALSAKEQFAERLVELGEELTRYLKRVREECGAPIRYLAVAEAHASGMPHLHILVHETIEGKSVRERTLSKQWALGFTKFRLATDSRAAAYVCKYISKSMLARVRASIRYGSTECNAGENQTPLGIASSETAMRDQTPHERARSVGRASAEAVADSEVTERNREMEFPSHGKLHCTEAFVADEQAPDFPGAFASTDPPPRKPDAYPDTYAYTCENGTQCWCVPF